LLRDDAAYVPEIVAVTGAWSIFTVWEQVIEHKSWKAISDENIITQRLLIRNRTNPSMSSDSPFDRVPLAEEVGLDCEVRGVDDMLQGTFRTDREVLKGAAASSEMKSFIQALQILISKVTGEPVPTMVTEMTVKDSCEIFNHTKESTASYPPGIHYGHYISACKIDSLAAVNLIFMVTPFKAGSPLY